MKTTNLFAILLAVLVAISSAEAVTINMVPIGNPGNAPDTKVMVPDGTSGYGPDGHPYYMAKYDVTVGQYVEFLNAVATTSDPYGLYDSHMVQDNFFGFATFGVSQNGSPGSYNYS